MASVMKFVSLIGVSVVVLMSTSASTAVVCNKEGDCWHTPTEYPYRPTFGLTVHESDWEWREGEKHAWREHEGKGYWKGGSWQTF